MLRNLGFARKVGVVDAGYCLASHANRTLGESDVVAHACSWVRNRAAVPVPLTRALQ